MNILNYTLKLNDQMSTTLGRVGVSSNKVGREVEDLRTEVEKLDKTTVSGISNSFNGLAKIIGRIGIGAIIGRALGKSVTEGMNMEMQEVSFEVLLGSAEKAKKMINEIAQYGAKGIGVANVSSAVQMMKGFNIETDEIMKNIKALGDISMGEAGKFNLLTLAFSQMSSTGKLTGQDLLQMINAGFNPLTQMSKTTGKSLVALRDDMARGLITSDMVKQSFYEVTEAGGQYNGMIEKMSQTTKGQWNQSLNTITQKLITFYNNYLQPVIFPALKVWNSLLNDPIETIKNLTSSFSTKFPIIAGAIIAVTAATITYKTVTGVASLATSAWTAAQWLLNVALTANPVGLVVAGIVALIAVISYLILKIDGWGDLWTHTINGAKLTFEHFTAFVKGSWSNMQNELMIGLNKIKEGWFSFKDALGIGNSSENKKMLQQIHDDTQARKRAIAESVKSVESIGISVHEEFGKAKNSLSWNKTSFSDVFGDLKAKIGLDPASIPGMPVGMGSGYTGGSTGGSESVNSANAIATGGSKTTNVTINIGEMGNRIVINSGNIKEGASRMRDIVLDELTRALSMAQGQI